MIHIKIKRFALLALTIFTMALMTMTSFAGTAYGPGCEPEYSGMSDMVYDLFSNVEDNIERQMAIDTALVMIGEKTPKKVYSNGGILIGSYEGREIDLNDITKISLLGTSAMCLGKDGDKICVVTDLDYRLDEAAIEENRRDLERIYGVVKYVQNAVSGMDDLQKLHYIQEYIGKAVPTYVRGISPVIAQTLGSGEANCGGYTAIVWLLGINAGLQIDCVSGYVNVDGVHAWNTIVIDGTEYWSDITWDITTGTEKYFLMDPESFASDERRLCPNALELIVGCVQYS